MNFVVVDGFSFMINPPNIQADITLTGVPSLTTEGEGKGVCKDGFSFVVTNITDPVATATIPDPGPYPSQFNATASETEVDGLKPLRLGDESDTINATPQIPVPPPGSPTPFPVSFTVVITDANQTSVQCN